MNISPITQINFENQTPSSYIIEASAGTGKTWTLERLYIKALLEGSITKQGKSNALDIKNILVVTFTKAAAQELSLRIYNAIEYSIKVITRIQLKIKSQASDDFVDYLVSRERKFNSDLQLLQIAQSSFDNAQIFTIHSFYSQVIKQYPILCNNVSNFEIITSHHNLLKPLIKKFLHHHIAENIQNNNILDELKATLFTSKTKLETGIIQELSEIINNATVLDIQNQKLILHSNIKINIKSKADKVGQAARIELIKCAINYINLHISDLSLFDQITNDDLINILHDSIHNPSLSEALANNYRICFIDEFQDTDKRQWYIFSEIYKLHQATPRGYVVIVGDPKQSIYGFRGADIQTYVAAREIINKTNPTLNLVNNYRSTPPILEFINKLFADTTALGNGISHSNVYSQVKTPEPSNIATIQVNSINIVVEKSAECKSTKISFVEYSFNLITHQIIKILANNPAEIKHIAVLVEKNDTALSLIKYLNKYNIPAVTSKVKSIYQSDAISFWLAIITTLIIPENSKNKKLLLATKLYGFDYIQIYNHFNVTINPIIEILLGEIDTYITYSQKHSFTALTYVILGDITKHQSNHLFTPRLITDMYHVARLLDQLQSRNKNLQEILYEIKYKTDSVDEANIPDEEIIILDQDVSQIKIITQHAAKGLEFKYCFVIFNKEEKPSSRLKLIYSNQTIRNFTEEELAESEAEDRYSSARLCYVSLTRAKEHLFIYYNDKTIFNTLWQNGQNITLPSLEYNQYSNEELTEPTVQEKTKLLSSTDDIKNIDLAIPTTQYKMQSFSGLTKNIHNTNYIVAGKSSEPNDVVVNTSAILNNSNFYGAKFGLMFHMFCEEYQHNACDKLQAKYNLDDIQYQEMIALTKLVYQCPILSNNTNLGNVQNLQHELEFTLNIKPSEQLLIKLQSLIAGYFGVNHPFSTAIYELTEISSGFLTGFIDVFVEHDSKYYIIDYKTNRLNKYNNYTVGDEISNGNEILISIAKSHYYLQYIIYLIAVKRHLEHNLNIPDASEYIGGGVYLYVRGIFNNNDGSMGIYKDENISSLIAQIDILLKG